MNNNIKLSILIPSYNHRNYITECLDAVLAIEIEPKEIILIDDGSTDDSDIVIRQWIAGPGAATNVRYLRRENRGVVATLNQALGLANGEYIYSVASDDIPVGTGIKHLVEHLDAHLNQQFVIGNAKLYWNNKRLQISKKSLMVHQHRHDLFFRMNPKNRENAIFFNYPTPILAQACLFRNQALKSIGGWDTRVRLDDIPLFAKLFLAYPNEGSDFSFLGWECIVKYRQHDHNTQHNIIGQFTLVHQMLLTIAPVTILNQSCGYNAAVCILVAIKRRELKVAYTILRSINSSARVHVPMGLFVHLWRYCQRHFLATELFN